MKKRILAIVFTVLVMLLAAPAIMGITGVVDIDGGLNAVFSSAAAHKHKYTAKVTKKATCTKSGVKKYTCKCGDSYTKKIAATGHKNTKTVKAKAATCTKAGYTKGVYCNDCKTYTSGHKTVKALGHKYSSKYTTDKKATCTKDGSKSKHCTRDGCTAKKSVTTIKKTGHKYTNACDTSCNTCKAKRTIKHNYAAATCTKPKTCKVCDAISGKKLGHKYSSSYTTDKKATCTAAGSKSKHCTRDDCTAKTSVTTIKKLGHKYTNACDTSCNTCKATRKITHDYVAATCTAPKTCKVCGDTSGSAAGHKATTIIPGKYATCTEDGLTDGVKCSSCGIVITAQTTIPAKGHTEEIVPAVEATCTVAGLSMGKRCSVCEEVLVAQTVVAVKGHTEVAVAGKAPTCTETGLTEGKKCSVCNTVTLAQTVTPAKGHTEEIVPAVEATCTVAGLSMGKRCSVCEEVLVAQTVVAVKGHTEVAVAGKAPTCTETGLTEGKHCSVCEKVLVEQTVVPELGHTEGEVVVENNIAADCKNSGSYDEVVYCTVCSYEILRINYYVSALGHSYNEPVVENVVKPGCETDGSYDEVYYCTVCGEEANRYTYTDSALGHTEGEAVVDDSNAPDCINDGSYIYIYYCTVCNEEMYRETTTVSALGHTDGEVVVVTDTKPDCVNDGLLDSIVYCAVCEEELGRDTMVIPALGHTTGEAVKENEISPDCENGGSYDEVWYCTVCNEEVYRHTQSVPALGHTEGDPVIENESSPDCENGAWYDVVYYCTVCKMETNREIGFNPALGHTEVIDEAVEPTCTETGLTEGKHCSVCNAVIVAQEVVPVRHSLQYVEGTAATCEKEGSLEHYKCSACDKLFADAEGETEITEEDLVTSAAHDFVNKYFERSCEVGGYYVDECTVCKTLGGEVVYDGTEATGHSYTETSVAATCEEDGYTLKVCTSCEGEEKIVNEDDPAKGHDFPEEPAKSEAPTCQANGFEEYVCQTEGCGAVNTVILDTIACAIDEENGIKVAGTKNEDGTTSALCHTEYKCIYCERVVAVTENYGAHSRMRTISSVDATCTTSGTVTKECRDCGYTYTDTNEDAMGHSTDSEFLAPTCTEDGYITVTAGYCYNCNENIPAGDPIILPAKGHQLTGVQTCDTSVVCETCGHVEAAALGHNYSKESSKTGKMIETFFCTRCGKANDTAEEKLATFNAVTRRIKTDFYAGTDDKMITFGKQKTETSYSKFNFGIYTSMIKGMYEEEMANSPDQYSGITSRQVKWNLPINGVTTSELTVGDIDSISVERLSGVDFNDVLSGFDTQYTTNNGSKTHDLSPYKAIKVSGNVLKVTVDVRNEKYYGGIENLNDGDKTSLEKIFGVDVRESVIGFSKGTDGKLYMEDNQSADGYEMKMSMKLNDLSTDGKVTYYFLEETYEPIIALYTANEAMDQDINMQFTIGISIKGTMAPVIKTTNTNVYIFPGYTAN